VGTERSDQAALGLARRYRWEKRKYNLKRGLAGCILKSMKRFLSCLLLLFLLPLHAVAANSSVSHDLHLTLDPPAGRLTASDRLTVPTPAGPYLDLHFAPQVEVTAVEQAGSAIPWNLGGEVLHIGPLPRIGKQLTLEIRYRGRFADPVPTAPLNNEDPSYGVAAAITPVGTFLAGGAGWYPDLPDQPARFRIRVETPAGTWAVTAGRLVKRGQSASGNFIVWQTEHPLPGLTLAAGPFRIAGKRSGNIPLYTFFTAAHSDLANIYLQSAGADLDLYQRLFGSYPFPKFAVAENFFPTGYGFPSWTLLGSSIVPLPFIVTTSLAHEIGHSWWGNGVRVDYRGGNWSEGLATYVADYLLKERSSAAEARDYRQNILRSYASLVSTQDDYPLDEFIGRRSKVDQAIGYGKSAMVFHMARRWVGDAAFWAGLRRVAKEKMFQKASWDDFARALDPDGKRGMAKFFDQWVRRPGAPVLRLADVKVAAAGGTHQVTGHIDQQQPTFDLEIPLRLETDAGSIEQVVHLQGPAAPFSFTTRAKPLRLLVDPEAEVFRRLDPAEVPATVNSLRGSASILAIIASHTTPAVRKAAHDLLTGLGQQATWVEEAEATPEQVKNHDLLLVGWPGRRDLRPRSPGQLEVGAGRFQLAGEDFSDPQDVLFAALPHPSSPGRHAGLFLPLGDGGAGIAARKIPHYGKYSYLAFIAGNNRVKGTWAVTRSPLICVWPPSSRHQ
jgi:Peptidase family M1 domain